MIYVFLFLTSLCIIGCRDSVQQPRGVGMGRKMGGRFKKEGTYVYLWLIQVDVWQKSTYYCKVIIFLLKINNFLKNQEDALGIQNTLTITLQLI